MGIENNPLQQFADRQNANNRQNYSSTVNQPGPAAFNRGGGNQPQNNNNMNLQRSNVGGGGFNPLTTGFGGNPTNRQAPMGGGNPHGNITAQRGYGGYSTPLQYQYN